MARKVLSIVYLWHNNKPKMKHIIFAVSFFLNVFVYGQEIHLGVDVSPGWNLNSHRTNTTAWYAEHGYGINAGLAVKYFYNEYNAFQTGLNFEYVSFDNWFDNQLVSSLRFGSLHVPLLANIELGFAESMYIYLGGGVNYLVLNKNITYGIKNDISPSIDKFQPYAALGVNTFTERNSGYFEFGVLGRYHFMELWDEDYPQVEAFSSHIVALDLLIRYYI